MSEGNEYLNPNQSALLDAIYRAISRYKTNRMWTPNGQAIAEYAECLFPDLGQISSEEIKLFVQSPEAAELVRHSPLPNLKTSLDAAIVCTGRYSGLSGFLVTVQMIHY
ncbi:MULTISPECIES: hypothetical protein [Pseudomonas]|uniref:hypothetical protein n=1 Tax=Pseudomonas TaxID=286 RepID=UPI0018A628B6|nr:hypothetical protein [Pseudomonas monteilii]BBV97894.1 hypothetical protein STW0522PSE72_32450 [Pseudomonas monteilii]